MAVSKKKQGDKELKKMDARRLKKIIGKLRSDRGQWESHWQDVADYFFTRKNDIISTRSPGEKRAFRLLDNTGMYANEMLAGALHGMLTNPDTFWFELTTGKPRLDQEDEVRTWLQDSMRIMHGVLNNSNFQTEVHEMYMDLCSFGTGCTLVEEDKEDIVRFKTKFIRDYLVAENHRGTIDQIYCEWKASAAELVDAFGLEKLHEKVKENFEQGRDDKFTCVHAVYPKTMLDPDDKSALPWKSEYWILEHDHLIEEGGFNEFPYLVPRWTKAAGEAYGRSPAMNALPEMKVLNKMNETMLIGAQKVVDPPIQMPDDGFVMPIITTPGGINYYRPGSQDVIKPLFNDTRLDFGYQAMEDRRKRVRDSYYVDHLRLQQGGPMMTATEVLQRTEESMRLLGPMLGRQQVEFLRRLIARVYRICMDRGVIPEVPEVLRTEKLTVKYSSLIAKSQRVNEAQSILRTMQAIGPFLQLDPSVALNFDGHAAARIIAMTYGAPQEILKKQKDVEKAQAAQAQAAQQESAALSEAKNSANALDTAKALQIARQG